MASVETKQDVFVTPGITRRFLFVSTLIKIGKTNSWESCSESMVEVRGDGSGDIKGVVVVVQASAE